MFIQLIAIVIGYTAAKSPETPLEGFKRFPLWMWKNQSMLNFVKKIRDHNIQTKTQTEKVSLYGLDLYCLHEAAQGVIDYLQQYDPDAAKQAIQRYACFDHASMVPHQYGYFIKKHLKKDCIKEVSTQFLETQRLIYQNLSTDVDERELQFYALQNAQLVKMQKIIIVAYLNRII